MKPDIRDLTPDEQRWLEDAVDVAASLMQRHPPLAIADAQDLYDDMLERRDLDPGRIVALGAAFGELVRREGGFAWVRLKDEFGEETCVAGPADPAGNRAFIAPITMVRRRLKAEEACDLSDLRAEAVRALSGR